MREDRPHPELRIDPLSGLRAILAEEGGAVLAGDGDAGSDPLGDGRGQPDLFAARTAAGAHEVKAFPAPLTALELEDLAAEMTRWREWMRGHTGARCIHVSADEGAAHLYALPLVPAAVARERERFTAYSDRTQGRNLLADVVQEEVKRRERLVAVDSDGVAICPFAPIAPFHVQVIPRSPSARFEDEGPLCAALLHDVLGRLTAELGDPLELNLWVRTAPHGAGPFCWRIDVVPRLARPAGLELGAGIGFSTVSPEAAAERLRAHAA